MGLTPLEPLTTRVLRLTFAIAAASTFGFGCQQPVPTGNASGACASCHLSDFEVTSHPPHTGVRPQTCGVCHSTDSWHPDRLMHEWPLQGAHAKANCFACHSGKPPQFEGTSKDCISCHQAAKDKANATVAHHQSFPTTCEECHTTNAWKPTLPHGQAPPQLSPVTPQAIENPSKRHTATVPASGQPRKSASAKPKPVTISPAPAINRPTPDVVSGASPVRRK